MPTAQTQEVQPLVAPTPGPWRAVVDGEIVYVTADGAGPSDICDLYHRDRDGTTHTHEAKKGEAFANAKMIAAAPRMLEMLLRLRVQCQSDTVRAEADALITEIDEAQS